MAGELHARYQRHVVEAVDVIRVVIGANVRAIVLFGSVARGTPNYESDIDLLIIADSLPHGHRARRMLADTVDTRWRASAEAKPELTLVLRTPDEIRSGFAFLLDIAHEGIVVFDTEGIAKGLLAALRDRLARSGAKRVQTGATWHWDLLAGAIVETTAAGSCRDRNARSLYSGDRRMQKRVNGWA